MTSDSIAALTAEIVACRACPRLVKWREQAAADPPSRFAIEEYWARPVPGFGESSARVLIVGLAPAANGGNRTGRVFTGDRSGDFLFAALHTTGFANQAASISIDDGLVITGAYIAAVVRCAPPDNDPTIDERDNCMPFLVRELALLRDVRVIVALGAYAWDGALRAIRGLGIKPARKPKFGHMAEARVGPYLLLGSYHPSQQNTFTGRLTPEMMDEVLARAREAAELDSFTAPE